MADLSGKNTVEVNAALDEVDIADGRGSIIVDGGALTGSSQVVDVAERADLVLVVARIGHDTLAEVAVATNLSDAPAAVACTRGSLLG